MNDPKFWFGLLILTWPVWFGAVALNRGWLVPPLAMLWGAFIVVWPLFVVSKTREMRRAK